MTTWVRQLVTTGNFARLLISLICAFALWAWVEADRDPEQDYNASQVQVTVRNQPDGLSLVGSLPLVNIRLQGPQSVIQTIDTSSIQAYIDLSDRDAPGRYTERIRIEAPDGLRTKSSDPESISVELDTVVSREFDVVLLTPNVEQRNLLVTGTNVAPETVIVTGVEQNVTRVERVIVEADIGDQTISFSNPVVPVAVDANNDPIVQVSMSPETVELTIELEIRGKEVPVYVQCECDAADGFEVVGQPLANPNTVLIDGPAEQLEQVNFVYTIPIDTGNLVDPTVLQDIPLDVSKLPESVTIDQDFVDVSVRVEQATFSETFENIPVQVFGEGPNMRVTVSPSTLTVELEGPQQDVGALTDRDIAVVVDVSGLQEGTHQVRPRLILPPQVSYSDPPPQVIVTIVEIDPTPTPESEPEPTQPEPEATGTSPP